MAITIRKISCPNANVSNSDDSYTASVESGGTLEIPDEAITINSAAFITKPSKKDQDILLKDVSGNTITPVSLTSDTITILDAVSPTSNSNVSVFKTGADVSYTSGDDGADKLGRGVDFLTLSGDNVFGNTNRFVDFVGGQTYTNGIALDTSTDNGVSILGYYLTLNSSEGLSNALITVQSLVVGGLSGWTITNVKELMNIVRYNGDYLDYAPFNIGKGNSYIMSSTIRSGATYSYRVRRNLGHITDNAGSGAQPSIACRYITYTELGL